MTSTHEALKITVDSKAFTVVLSGENAAWCTYTDAPGTIDVGVARWGEGRPTTFTPSPHQDLIEPGSWQASALAIQVENAFR